MKNPVRAFQRLLLEGGCLVSRCGGLVLTSFKPSFCQIRRVALCVALGMGGGAVFGKTPALNPAKLGTFCPPGSELADAKHTDIISVQEQAKIKKSVQGFMALDADVRRSFGHPLGSQAYWEKGYAEKFDPAKEVPRDWVRYIAYRYSNVCIEKDMVLAIILLDVADMSGRKIEPSTVRSNFLSPQSYWDAFSKAAVVLPEKEATPEQPLLFTAIPFYKDGNSQWLIKSRKVPTLRKIIVAEWREEIRQTNKFSQCQASIQRFQSNCAANEKKEKMLIKYSRPAWSVYPMGMKLGGAKRQPVKP